MKKHLRTFLMILVILLALAVIGLLVYQIVIEKKTDSSTIFRAAIIFAGLVLTFVRLLTTGRTSQRNRMLAYEKEYAPLMGNAFINNPKAKKAFYKAIDSYNRNEYRDAIVQWKTIMEKWAITDDDRFAIFAFIGLCYQDAGFYDYAANFYDQANGIRRHYTLRSNAGLCYQRMGMEEEAAMAYEDAIELAPNNPVAYNNFANLLIRKGQYAEALEYAQTALRLQANFKASLSAVAICHAMLGNHREYEDAYRRAVAEGADGEELKDFIRDLKGSDWDEDYN